jgi:hypothetical protein
MKARTLSITKRSKSCGESKKRSKKLGELKEAGEDAWEDLKPGINSAWDSLGDALKSTTNRFK